MDIGNACREAAKQWMGDKIIYFPAALSSTATLL